MRPRLPGDLLLLTDGRWLTVCRVEDRFSVRAAEHPDRDAWEVVRDCCVVARVPVKLPWALPGNVR